MLCRRATQPFLAQMPNRRVVWALIVNSFLLPLPSRRLVLGRITGTPCHQPRKTGRALPCSARVQVNAVVY